MPDWRAFSGSTFRYQDVTDFPWAVLRVDIEPGVPSSDEPILFKKSFCDRIFCVLRASDATIRWGVITFVTVRNDPGLLIQDAQQAAATADE